MSGNTRGEYHKKKPLFLISRVMIATWGNVSSQGTRLLFFPLLEPIGDIVFAIPSCFDLLHICELLKFPFQYELASSLC